MFELTDSQIAEYFHRSFSAVDGLWFMKLEKRFDFDTALDIDIEVWRVVPKIQARLMRSLTGFGKGIDALREAIETKLTLEAFVFRIERSDGEAGFTVCITECPWHNLMVKSGREHLSEKVGDAICSVEYKVWASEFGSDIRFHINQKLCGGKETCMLQFSK